MQRVADNYRKLRNTFRFLLGNLNGFDPAKDSIPEADLLPLDRYMLQRMRDVTERVNGWYADFQFHRIYHAVIEFCVVDLSAIYLDVLKDRMYTLAPTSRERRSAQTVIYTIAEALARLVAPILSFTADEVWQYLPPSAGRLPSVHLALFPKPEEIAAQKDQNLLAEWATLFAVRDQALRNLEEARKEKRIGKALEAKIRLTADSQTAALLKKYETSLKEFFNVSQVEVLPSADPGCTAETLPADGEKCNRCWNFRTDVADSGPWQKVCGRCRQALNDMGYEVPA